MLRMKCKMCSSFAKTIICHKGPYNGKSGSHCLYTKDGRRRKGYEAINEVAAQEESESEEEKESSEGEESEDNINYADSEDWEPSEDEESSEDEDATLNRIYGIREGRRMPKFANKDGSPAIGAYE